MSVGLEVCRVGHVVLPHCKPGLNGLCDFGYVSIFYFVLKFLVDCLPFCKLKFADAG